MRLSTVWIAIVLLLALWVIIGWSIYDLSKQINAKYAGKIQQLNLILEKEGIK